MDRTAQSLHRGGFAVNDERQPWRLCESTEPAEDFVRVGVRGHRFDERDLRLDGNHFAVDLDGFVAVHELPAPRASCLVAHEQHRVA